MSVTLADVYGPI